MSEQSFIERLEVVRREKNAKFSNYGLKRNPFTPFLPDTAKQSLVDRDSAKEEFINNFNRLVDGEILHIFIRAKRGYGKSHLLHYFYQEIKKSYERLSIPKPIFFDSTVLVKNWLKENPKIDKEAYLFIDDASLFSSSPQLVNSKDAEYVKEIYKNKNIKTINAWQESVEVAMPFHIKPTDITEECEDIEIGPLERKDDVALLKRRIVLHSENTNALEFFSDSFFEELSKISHGNPRLLLRNASKCFESHLGKISKFTDKEVCDFAEKHGIKATKQIEEAIHQLTPAQKKVVISISAICLTKNKSECSLKEISQALDITKPAVLGSLQLLVESDFVKSRQPTNSLQKLYSIEPEYKEYFDERFKDDIKIYERQVREQISKKIIKEFT